jgi:hypothetical protein
LPSGTFEHVPSAVESAHDSQLPAQARLQQYPCAQNFDMHSDPSPQGLPFVLRPHEPFVQLAGEVHSAFVAQTFWQTFAPQMNGKQELTPGVTHEPLPSHVDEGVKVVVDAGHVEVLHTVSFAYFWQAPAWHLPLAPQLAAPMSTQRPAGSALFVATFVHVP